MTLGEMLYQNNAQKLNVLDIEAIKNNRVIAAKFPQTSETSTYSAFSSVDNDNTSSSPARQEENAENSKKSLREDTSLPQDETFVEASLMDIKRPIGYPKELGESDAVWNPAKVQSFDTIKEFLDGVCVDVVQKSGKYTLTDGDVTETFNSLKALNDYVTDEYISGQFDIDPVYEVYLNITNPLVVDGKGKQWNKLP